MLKKEWILYEDGQLLVVYKPAGIAVQSARASQMDLEHMLLNYLAGLSGGRPYLGMIHRLDQPVEGILVFARTPKAAAELSRQIQSGKMEKRYLAATERVPEQKEGTLVDYLKKDGRTNLSRTADRNDREAKRAELSYRVLKASEQGAVVEILLKTGRHHQIRVQMAHAGMPLIGDRKYGAPDSEERLCLCAYRLKFEHPATRRKMEFSVKPENPGFGRISS